MRLTRWSRRWPRSKDNLVSLGGLVILVTICIICTLQNFQFCLAKKTHKKQVRWRPSANPLPQQLLWLAHSPPGKDGRNMIFHRQLFWIFLVFFTREIAGNNRNIDNLIWSVPLQVSSAGDLASSHRISPPRCKAIAQQMLYEVFKEAICRNGFSFRPFS